MSKKYKVLMAVWEGDNAIPRIPDLGATISVERATLEERTMEAERAIIPERTIVFERP